MPVLTQQTDRAYAACQGAGMLDCQGWSWRFCCSRSGARKLGFEEGCAQDRFLFDEAGG